MEALSQLFKTLLISFMIIGTIGYVPNPVTQKLVTSMLITDEEMHYFSDVKKEVNRKERRKNQKRKSRKRR